MTLILALSGSSGCNDSLSCSPAPLPLAHQRPGLMPVPMKSTAKRFGGLGTAAADSDSSHGKAIVTPVPRRNVRREEAFSRRVFILRSPFVRRELLAPALVKKLATGHDAI